MSGKWPSAGCIAVCLSYSLVAAVFFWGLSRPDLDRVWTLGQALKIGKRERLTTDERELFQGAMARHPNLAQALLDGGTIGLISANSDGWLRTPTATIVRTPASLDFCNLVLEVQTPQDLIPFTVEVRGRGWKNTVEVTRQGALNIPMPAPEESPEIIEVRMRGRKFEADPSMLGLRVVLEVP